MTTDEKLVIQIKAEVDDAKSKIKEVNTEIDNLEQNEKQQTESSNSGWASQAVAIAAVTAAVVAVTKATGTLINEVIEAYGQYEQLTGGVEKLFGDSADVVEEYASNAYQTAQISANDYMQTVTSFSASLLQSLGGDTAAAAEYADLAITDMADNANTFGTSMESIQNAYQGFAKQNYTMLDNLKLGYGGTKEEMERLIEDANKLAIAQGEAGDLTIDSYADVVEAIHLVQEEMGITGTTALEASETVEGSINTLKASLTNLITGFGSADTNITKLTKNATTSFKQVLDNISPVVEAIKDNIPEAIEALQDDLPYIIDDMCDIIGDGIEIIGELFEGLIECLPEILEGIPDIMSSVMTAACDIAITLITSLPEIFDAATQAIADTFYNIYVGIDKAFGDESRQKYYDNLEALEDLKAGAQELTQSIEDLNTTRLEEWDSINANVAIYQTIADGLEKYVDENGKIKEGYEDEVLALQALAEQYGIKITVQGDTVEGYQDLQAEIDATIEKYKQEAFVALEASNMAEAMEAKIQAQAGYTEAYNEYTEHRMAMQQAEADGDDEKYREEQALMQSSLETMSEYGLAIETANEQIAVSNHNMTAAMSGDWDGMITSMSEVGQRILDETDAVNAATLQKQIENGDKLTEWQKSFNELTQEQQDSYVLAWQTGSDTVKAKIEEIYPEIESYAKQYYGYMLDDSTMTASDMAIIWYNEGKKELDDRVANGELTEYEYERQLQNLATSAGKYALDIVETWRQEQQDELDAMLEGGEITQEEYEQKCQELADTAKQKGNEASSNLAEALVDKKDDVGESASIVTDAMLEKYDKGAADAAVIGAAVATNLARGIITKKTEVADNSTALFNAARNKWVTGAGSWAALGEASGNGIIAGAVLTTSDIWWTYYNLGITANSGFTTALDINSPSKVMAENGLYSVLGIVEGIEDNAYLVTDVMSDLSSELETAFCPDLSIDTQSLEAGVDLSTQYNASLSMKEESISDLLANIVDAINDKDMNVNSNVSVNSLLNGVNRYNRISGRAMA